MSVNQIRPTFKAATLRIGFFCQNSSPLTVANVTISSAVIVKENKKCNVLDEYGILGLFLSRSEILKLSEALLSDSLSTDCLELDAPLKSGWPLVVDAPRA